tara:strand:- start:143 stop:355 length:213 start_codon:yes stop_codon:yes gene_type:complete
MTKENNNKITINDEDYNVDDLSDEAKKCIAQITDIRNRMNKANMESEMLSASLKVFSGKLTEELKKNNDS